MLKISLAATWNYDKTPTQIGSPSDVVFPEIFFPLNMQQILSKKLSISCKNILSNLNIDLCFRRITFIIPQYLLVPSNIKSTLY